MGAVELVTDSTAEPVTLQDAKDHLRVDSTHEDTLIEGLVKAARKRAERYCRTGLIKQTWRDTRDDFPVGDVWELPRGPVFSTTGVVVTYRPSSGGELTFASTNYIVDDSSLFGRVVLKQDAAWPSTKLQEAVGAEVTWEVGYGKQSTDVPEDLRHALKLMIGTNYEHREDVVVGSQVVTLPRAAESLMWGYRVPEVP